MFSNRRKQIIKNISSHSNKSTKSVLLVCAGFENHRYNFRQESSFYYLTGITEPAVILCCYFDGPEILYVPFYNQSRDQWFHTQIGITSLAQNFGLDKIKYQGEQVSGYSCPPFFTVERYSELIADLKANLGSDGVIYTLMDERGWRYFHQMQLVAKLQQWLAGDNIKIEDASDFVHNSRRVKDQHEVALISRAVEVTINAQHQIAKAIKPGKFEYQIQGLVDYSFKDFANCEPAFPSIVASGKNTTVLHSIDNTRKFEPGDLVVVDIGAEHGMYAADLTRTYPVGGKFTQRQKEVYNIVLQTQEYVQSLAKPGIYLNNRECPENSLHHLAVKFLQQHGYDKYFVHGIGHFLGLDVHDVGDHKIPLQVGDVFTIEPGIYIPEENLGIRIEDDFMIIENGCACLSEKLLKKSGDIERLMLK
jgi:Xaa-Pro aminopeptidase